MENNITVEAKKIKDLAFKIGQMPLAYMEGLNDAMMLCMGSSVEDVIEFRKRANERLVDANCDATTEYIKLN